MSKAFTRDSDPDPDDEAGDAAPPSSLPGGRNPMTRVGYERLRAELLQLIDSERPTVVETVHWAAKNGDRSENGDYLYGKKRLREIDRRIRFLSQRLERADVVDPWAHHGNDQVFLGASVAYRLSDGVAHRVTIVGVDEADPLRAHISWVSPVARALLRAREGDEVRIQTPQGEVWAEIEEVWYPAPPG